MIWKKRPIENEIATLNSNLENRPILKQSMFWLDSSNTNGVNVTLDPEHTLAFIVTTQRELYIIGSRSDNIAIEISKVFGADYITVTHIGDRTVNIKSTYSQRISVLQL